MNCCQNIAGNDKSNQVKLNTGSITKDLQGLSVKKPIIEYFH